MHRLRKESMREEEMDYSNLFVVLMGLGTVFAGLLCIILAAEAVSPAMIAAVAAAIAEDLGTNVSAIRIVSMKKV